ncbi:MAG: PA2169 family four-helix-bundle protein [Acidobacteria bacterium]|nr:PA2169 family four-helix-bundle protein [Acidobacteriota bacterium]
MASTAQLISTLNNLIQTCRDGQEGFRIAADGVAGAELKELFHGYARQRASFAGELQDEVRRVGGEAADAGSVAGSLHRGWLGLRTALTGADERAVLAECERGEDAALAAYRAALGVDMPASVRTTVERQFAEVKEAHEHIRALDRAAGD